jgi:hypothetical protein
VSGPKSAHGFDDGVARGDRRGGRSLGRPCRQRAVLEQIKAANEGSRYQSKSIKATVSSSKMELLGSLGKPSSSKDAVKLAEVSSSRVRKRTLADKPDKPPVPPTAAFAANCPAFPPVEPVHAGVTGT